MLATTRMLTAIVTHAAWRDSATLADPALVGPTMLCTTVLCSAIRSARVRTAHVRSTDWLHRDRRRGAS